MHTAVTITPHSPTGAAIVLGMPDSVDDRDYDVTFTFRDPTDGAGNPLNIRALLAGVLCDGSVQNPIVTRNGLVKRIARDPAPMVRAQWSRIEPFSATAVAHSAYGGLYIAADPFDRSLYTVSVVLYKAKHLVGFPSKTIRSAP